MNGLRSAIATELLKAHRSGVPWGVAIGFTLVPLVIGMLMLILKDPETARSLGLLGLKAQLTAGTADWPTFLSMLSQALTVGGAILFAFLPTWVFGREFADRTVRSVLAIPTSRRTIVIAKAIVVAAWAAAIATWAVVLAMGIGAVIDLPDWSAADATNAIAAMALAVALTILLQSFTALMAGVGRGYLPGLAWAVATVASAQVLTVLGWGAWFPWAVPAILAGAGGATVEPVTAPAVVVVVIVGLLGLAATLAWWDRADQTG